MSCGLYWRVVAVTSTGVTHLIRGMMRGEIASRAYSPLPPSPMSVPVAVLQAGRQAEHIVSAVWWG